MNNNMKYIVIFIIGLIALNSNKSLASTSINIGTSLSLLNLSDPNFEYTNNKDQLQIASINLGLTHQLHKSPIIISAFSNKLIFNRAVQREVKSKASGNIYTNKTKVEADTLMMGYQINRFIPAVFVSNVAVDKGIYSNGRMIADKKQNSIVKGFNLSYIINRDITSNTAILLPNSKLGIEAGIIFGINYNFNLNYE